MDLREEQGSEDQAQPTVSTPAASQGNVGAGNGGGGSQEAILTMRHFQQMMATVSNLSQQNVALQQQLLELAKTRQESSGKAGQFTLETKLFDPKWAYKVKWDPKKQSLREWIKEWLEECKSARPGQIYFRQVSGDLEPEDASEAGDRGDRRQ